MKSKFVKRAVSALAGMAMLLTGILTPGTEAHAAEGELPDGMEMVASNDQLELWFDGELAECAVRVKETGDIWFTNPPEADEDPAASSYYKGLLKSQLSIRFFNESVQALEMDSYNDAAAEGQISWESITDGVRVTYTMGQMADKFVLPQVISPERMDSYLAQMDEKTAKNVKRNYLYLDKDELRSDSLNTYLEKYPSLEEHPIYVIMDGVKDYKKEELMEYFQEVGYTAEDMEADNLENGYESLNEKPYFIIAVSYFLDGDSFVAEIDPNTIEYDTENYYLTDIKLLKYFGAGGAGDEGYLFVPDGSGALINFNNGKTSATPYIGYVYGEDKTNQVNLAKRSETDQALTVRMPVFGLKNGDRAFFAVVEGGAAGADINASVGGVTDSYNYVHAGFSYLNYGPISLGDIVGSNSFQMYSRPDFAENFRVCYRFLHGDKADYSGMASCYQSYLCAKGIFGERAEGNVTPFYANFIGAIQKWDSILGIKCRVTKELSTYEQTAKALEELTAGGVEGIRLEYSGWSTGGLHGGAPGGVKALSELDTSGMKRKEFQQKMQEAGIPVFYTAQLQYVYRDMAFDGYQEESRAPRYYDRTIARASQYLIPNGFKDSSESICMISPYYVESMADTFLNRTKNYELSGISVEKLGCDLFSDFNEKSYVSRQAAVGKNCAALEKLAAGSGGQMLGDNANAYAWQYLSDIKNVPLDSNRTQMIDEVVPFYEMVLHGYRDYTGEPLNLCSDYEIMVLKSIETGAGISFEWICEENSILKNTDFDSLYSVTFAEWKEKAAESWKKVNDAVGDLRSQRIVKHERPEEGVCCTVYEDGTRVIVNYNRESVQYQGNTVGARDFLVVKER